MLPAFVYGPGAGLCLRVRFLLPLILIGLLLPSAAWAQVSYTGSAATQNFGSQAIGTTSAATTFSFSVAAGTTVGSIAVVTQGAPNLDFTEATGGTCAAQDYASATTCSVDVTFAPKFAGLREGAVVFFSAANNTGTVLGKAAIYGIGIAPQIAFSDAPATAVDPMTESKGLFEPQGLARDGAGDLFIADFGNNRVVEMPAGGGSSAIDPTVNGFSLSLPTGVAVDGAGDLYISDQGNDRVVEVPAGGGAAIAIQPVVNGKQIAGPTAIALDGLGDLFIADGTDNSRVVEVPAGGGAAIAIDPMVEGKGLNQYEILGLAVDGAGDLFISDDSNERVLEVPANGGATIVIQPVVGGIAMFEPAGLALDGAGDLFISDPDDGRVVEVPAGGGAAIAFVPIVNGVALGTPFGLTLDGAGDLFIADNQRHFVFEILRSKAAPVSFPTATNAGTTDTTDGTQTVRIQNIGSVALTLTALSYPADFSEVSGDADACTSSTILSAGQECDLPVEFTPLHGGALSEDVMLTDNALNAAAPAYARQSIPLKGTGIQLDSIAIAPSSSFATLPGGSQQFTATGSYSGGSTLNLTSLVSWKSNNTTAVTIDASGLATAEAVGTATISASLAGVTSNAVTLAVELAAQASISVSSGSGQSTYETAAFASPLVAVVKDMSGNALQGVPVTFTAPSSGAGASFSNGAGAITVASDGNGLATVPVVANGTAGNYSVTATAAGISGSVSFSLTNLAWPVYSVTTLVDDAAGSGTNCTDPTLKVTSCSLRDAVTAANALAQTMLTPVTGAMMPTINFASSLNLSAQSPGSYNIANGGTLTISANMNIVGPGANLLTLNGAGNQIVNINSGTVFLSGVSLVNGAATSCNGCDGDGGGIYNNGTLTVTNSTFSGNSANGGSGNAGGPPEIGISGGYGYGGGIYNIGTLTVTNSTFSGNSANGGGGYGDAGGGNGIGGGIYNGGTLTVTNSTLSGNGATGGSGGNGSDGDGDIGFNGGGGSGGGISNVGTLTVTNSTFTGNSATGGGGGDGYGGAGSGGNGYGGGIENGGTLTVADSTFSGNSANGAYGFAGGNADGGGISNGGTLTVRNSALSGNSVTGGVGQDPSGALNGVANGAGIYNNLHGNADSNLYFNNLANGSEDDCNGCTTNTNAVSGDPKLTALGNYGGATQTLLPQPGSAAICAGAVGDIPVGVTTDQRGFSRTNSTYAGGTVCVDVGSVQTNYAMAFSTEPPAIVLVGQPISPAPAVGLTESGAPATAVTSSVAMTDSDALLSGTTTASFLSDTATFNNLLIPSVTSSDRLIATLALNPTLNLTAQSTAFQAQTTLPAALTSPTPGSALTGTSATFTWTPGTPGATEFDLWLGFNGAGSSDLYSSGVTTATSATLTGLQTKGVTIYARLYYKVGGVWNHNDYTYTEAASTAATIISPSPGTTLGVSGIVFNWTAGALVANYALWLGTSGPGSSSLYASPLSPALSVTVPKLPAKGAKVYARLYSEGSGGIQYVDYTYIEQ